VQTQKFLLSELDYCTDNCGEVLFAINLIEKPSVDTIEILGTLASNDEYPFRVEVRNILETVLTLRL
jgi:hypothetical protein